jgi:GTP cyclohydrolase I
MAKKIETVNSGSGFTNEGYNKIETWDESNINELSLIYYKVLKLIGENPEREGLVKTPLRVAKALHFLTNGYGQDPCKILNSAKFREDYKHMVLVKDIDLYSMCEHHMLPFFGKAHVAYIPDKYITGLSKIARIVEVFSRRLQVQERLTIQIRDTIQECLEPMGVAVVIEAQHMCMQIRGIQKQNSVTTTSAFTGVFLEHLPTREEFIHLIGSRLH